MPEIDKSHFKGKSVVSICDLSRDEILFILNYAKNFEEYRGNLFEGKVLATIFYEPSTRTRLSFESSMLSLGGRVLGFSSSSVSSVSKGETLWDTIKTVEGYVDIIVIRHPLEGSARLAAEAANIPVINGGDGANQHPTQTLLDLYTIMKGRGSLDNFKIGFVGDLKYGRTVHSLVQALLNFNCDFYFVSPESLSLPVGLKGEIEENGRTFVETENLLDVLGDVDILYVTRIQRERFPDPMEYEKVKNVYIITPEILRGVKENLKILHPMPRVNEISKEVDKLPYAYYFNQSKNGVIVRKALISLLLGVTL